MKHFLAILLISMGLSTKVEAATLTSWSTFGTLGCEDVASDSSAVSTNCGSASIGGLTAETYGSAGNGIVSAYASAWSNRDNSGFGTFFNNSRTFATIRDNITATWSSTGQQFNGTASFGIDLLGAIQADSGTSANADANLQVNGNTVYSFDSATDAADSISQANFGFTGTSSIFAYINAEARSCNIVASGTTCYSASDLGSSMRLTGLSFFDAAGADVTSQLTVSSESGFDYVTGASAHTRQPGPSPVPLPAAGWLMLIGFSSLGLMRLRQV
jgi:hypothetical protein